MCFTKDCFAINMSLYFLGFILVSFNVCDAIPLPGVKLLPSTSGELPVRPPYVQYSFGSQRGLSHITPLQNETRENEPTTSFKKSTLAHMTLEPQTPSNSSQHQMQNAKKEQQTSMPRLNETESPLVNMLNSLYGDSSWMRELGVMIDKTKITSTTTKPPPKTNIKQQIENELYGFYAKHVSVNSFGEQSHSPTTHALPIIINSSKPDRLIDLHNIASKINEKAVGNHFRTNAVKYPATSVHNKIEPVALHRVDSLQNNLSVTQPLSHQASKTGELPTSGTQSNPERFSVDKSSTSEIRENFSAGIGTFNANEINHAQHMFNPDKMFDQITQTGSDRTNANHKITFDADTVNQNFAYGPLNKVPPGVDATTLKSSSDKKETTGYNQNIQPNAFDANDLNMRLFAGQGSFMNNQPPGTDQFTKTSQFSLQKAHTTDGPLPYKETVVNKQEVTTPRKNQYLQSNSLSSVTSRPEHVQSSFNFVPGKLFPGQSLNMHRNNMESTSSLNEPTFLQSSRAHPIDTKFDPNALNAQIIFNPNSLSWVHKRSTEFPIDKVNDHLHSEIDHKLNTTHSGAFFSAIASHQSTSNATVIPTKPAEKWPTQNESVGTFNFDPNTINSLQGRFNPGQLTSGTSEKNAYGQSGLGVISMNNGLLNLLGLDNKHTESTNLDSGPQGFDANLINGAIANSFHGTKISNGSSLDLFSTSFKSNGFDPNKANIGFGNVIGTRRQNETGKSGFDFKFDQLKVTNSTHTPGFETGGFDPNSANVGFGPMLGMGGIKGATLNNAFVSSPNGQNSSSLLNYFGSSIGSFGGQNQYQSEFIGNFNPDTVNKAEYNPDKFNSMHLHFDPTNMLEKNPVLDKATLKTAVFDPDKVNLINWHQLLSPVDIFSTSNQGMKGLDQTGSSNVSQASDHRQVLFDPFKLMKAQLRFNGQFEPGTFGVNHALFDPMSMFAKASTPGSTTRAMTSGASYSTAPQTTTSSRLAASIRTEHSTKAKHTETTVLPTSTYKPPMPTMSVSIQPSTRNINNPGKME